MTFDQLKYFITVAEMGSFSNASVALYISQSTISKQIAALEHELGVELFSRKTKQIELTEAAENYIVDNGYNSAFGARPLKRFIQKEVETAIARLLIREPVDDGSTILVDASNGKIELTVH